ncbi:Nramp family divalent metal transporter [Herbiconiux sp. CPCC 203407]|uniref:Nramp family divalent metal transporter n=1 Tax=Herbiconiux oxytropis TaxID=2970915 RepID=A0AA41XBR3_9MICO|nr:Nramp family divalent metal transporter [Herbiconiux oxytropis]MCS5723147.1 Nramp family divalent metal transporter [Herbiconiux oxytropis]MCS5725296.1 Nramp family divalent metal transporter [Herbiconiux oxytropis]
MTTTLPGPAVRPRWWHPLALLGPAFVASIAYVDPGNVAANLTSGASYGYLLVWVLVLANGMAMLIQYQSAKLGIVTGRTLPEHVGARTRPWTRRAYWLQAEAVAAATDIAEVIGGALALNLLFGLPLVVGGVIVGVVSMGLLLVQSHRRQRTFEFVIVGFLAVIAIGFLAGLFVSDVDWGAAADGLVPRFDGTATVLLAASMLGATVMPHAIYLHSALARDRHHTDYAAFAERTDFTRPAGETAPAAPAPTSPHSWEVGDGEGGAGRLRMLLRVTRTDVLIALLIAGVVNISMLLLAAASLRGVAGTDTIPGAYDAIRAALGPGIATIFAIGLLASGLASTSVGAYAGSVIMKGLLTVRVPILARRAVTLVPALAVLAGGIDPTWALVLSQVFLSIGIPFALIPLIRLTGSRAVMGEFVDRLPVRILAWVVVALIVALNVVLIVLTVTGA